MVSPGLGSRSKGARGQRVFSCTLTSVILPCLALPRCWALHYSVLSGALMDHPLWDLCAGLVPVWVIHILQLFSCDATFLFPPQLLSQRLHPQPGTARVPLLWQATLEMEWSLLRYFNIHSIVSTRPMRTHPFMVHHPENRQVAPSATSVFACLLGQLLAGSCLQK